MSQSTEEQDLALVRSHANRLSEHFDTVQIFVTRASPCGGTINVQLGSGNWFARYGQVQAWVRQQNGEFHKRGATQAED